MSKKRRRRKKTRTPVRTATVALIVVAAFLVLFTAAQIISFCVTGMEQEQLIASVFTVCGLELGGLLLKRVLDHAIPQLTHTNDFPEDTEGDE